LLPVYHSFLTQTVIFCRTIRTFVQESNRSPAGPETGCVKPYNAPREPRQLQGVASAKPRDLFGNNLAFMGGLFIPESSSGYALGHSLLGTRSQAAHRGRRSAGRSSVGIVLSLLGTRRKGAHWGRRFLRLLQRGTGEDLSERGLLRREPERTSSILVIADGE
jgi:hypothetical protein